MTETERGVEKTKRRPITSGEKFDGERTPVGLLGVSEKLVARVIATEDPDHEGILPEDVAAETRLAKSSVYSVLDRLEDRGHVASRPYPLDPRKSLYELHPETREVFD